MKRWLMLVPLAALMVLLSLQAGLALTTITAGDMVITSKLMTFQDNMYVARGGLKATQKDSVLTSDRGIYDRSLELVKAIDNVKVEQPNSTLTCDYLEAYVKEDRLVGKGKPRLERISERQVRDADGTLTMKKTRLILTCKEIEGFNKENRFVAKGEVKLIEVPYREAETEEEAKENEKKPVSNLTCEMLEMFSNEDKAIARNDVVIITTTLRATGDKAIYLDRENRIIIVGHAHAWQTSKESPTAEEQVSELFATKIIYYPNEDRTIAVGEVHATVYPKGSKGPDEDKKDKKKKKKKGDEMASGSSEILPSEEGSPEGLPEGLPEGEYTPVGDRAGEAAEEPAVVAPEETGGSEGEAQP